MRPFLRGGLGTLPLAPISAATETEVPAIIERMEARLQTRRLRRYAEEVWSATAILLGLRYSAEQALRLLRGGRSMRESTVYQMILEEGEAKGLAKGRREGELAEARKILLRLGEEHFGPPDAHVTAAVKATTDLERLEALSTRLLRAASWEDLLGPPARRPRPRRRPKTSPGTEN